MDLAQIKIRNGQRIAKRERDLFQATSYNGKPRKRCQRQSLYNTYYRQERRLEYNYDFNQSKTLRWMYQQFHYNMRNYLGNSTYVKKMGRMDKIQRKQRLGFKPEINPLVRIFDKIQRIHQLVIKEQAFQCLRTF